MGAGVAPGAALALASKVEDGAAVVPDAPGVGLGVGVGSGHGAELAGGEASVDPAGDSAGTAPVVEMGAAEAGAADGAGVSALTGNTAPSMAMEVSSARTATSAMRAKARERIRRPSSADRVKSPWVPRMTARDAFGTHPAALQQAVLDDGLFRVARAARLKAA